MTKLRGILQVFLLALIFSVGANGVVMASNDLMHQKNCVHTSADQMATAHSHQGHADQHQHSNDPASDHDHNTCMIHACSAVAYEAHGTVEMPVFLLTVVKATEQELTPLGLADNFLRPPNT